jgi:hypothetical protein
MTTEHTRPSVGRIVHYVSYGTPGGEYGKECRAAIVNEVPEGVENPLTVGLCVLNPTGMFFNRTVPYDDGGETPGAPDCPDSGAHGNPFRYCHCGWIEASHTGGTWHWPERV